MLRRFLYIQVYRGHFLARIFKHGRERRFECSGLNHPRSLCGDFESIRTGFATAVRELKALRFGFIKPMALVHLIPTMEGGYTRAELWAFKLAAEQAGMGRVFMLDDKQPSLSDETLSQLHQGLGAFLIER